VRWDHRQTFDLSTSLNLNLNYASNTRVVRQNAIDPLQNTQQITSSLNFSKRYGWGTLTLGGNRRQNLSDGSVQQLLPAVTLSPVPIALGADITWSPGLSFTNNHLEHPARQPARGAAGRGSTPSPRAAAPAPRRSRFRRRCGSARSTGPIRCR
jgi:hypothetical protein